MDKTRALDGAGPRPTAHRLSLVPREASLISLLTSDLTPESRFSPAPCRYTHRATGTTAP